MRETAVVLREQDTVLRTRRAKARYGTKTAIAGRPVLMVKSGKKRDYVTPEELVEDLYGKPVAKIIFKDTESINGTSTMESGVSPAGGTDTQTYGVN